MSLYGLVGVPSTVSRGGQTGSASPAFTLVAGDDDGYGVVSDDCICLARLRCSSQDDQ